MLHQDGTKSEHGFVSAIPNGTNSFYVVWLDGRNTVSENKSSEAHETGAMTLRGRIVHADGTMEKDVELDNKVCDCCQTAIAAVADKPVIVYRDRSNSEIRDIARIGLIEDSFSETMIVAEDNWEIAGCPVNGPSINSFKNNVAVSWFTAFSGVPKVQVTFSEDGGKNFGMPIRVDNGNAIGRVDVVMISENDAIVSWVEPKGNDILFQIRKVSNMGALGNTITISKTSASRASGFPQMELLNDSLYFAWTELGSNKQTNVKSASIELQNL